MTRQRFPADDPFAGLDGRDGYHVTVVENPSRVTLSLVAYGRGSMVPIGGPGDASVTLLDVEKPTAAAYGAACRLKLLAAAVCRYLNTGGGWAELGTLVDKMEGVIPAGITFPGYHLTTSYLTTDCDYQHVFTKDDGSGAAALWNEPETGDSGLPVGGWVVPTTLEQIAKEQDDADAGPREVESEEA